MATEVRKATPADYEGFARVAWEVHEHHVALVPHIFRSAPVVISRDAFVGILANDRCGVLVAEEDGEIIGYAVLLLRQDAGETVVFRTYVELENFGVALAHRRGGVGRMLFEACVAWGKERGATRLELNVWEANRAALRFYEAMGMHSDARWLALDI